MDSGAFGLAHLLDVARRRVWIVLAILAIAVGAAAFGSYAQSKQYASSTEIVVGQGNSLFQPGAANAIQPFTATMGALVKSNVVAEQVIRKLGLQTSPARLLSGVSVSFDPQTAVLDITARAGTPAGAQQIAATLADVFSTLVKQRFGATPTAVGGVEQPPLTATIWDRATYNSTPVAPKPKRNIAIGFIVGLVLGFVAAFLRDHFDRAVRTREDVEAAYGVPVIGQIPFVKRAKSATVETFWTGFPEGAEAFRTLRANLQYLGVSRPLRTILIASASPEQGKTTVAANLAVALSQSGATACAVEADLRRPRLHEPLGVSDAAPGLTNLLVGAATLHEAITEVSVPVGRHATTLVSVVPSGPLPPNPSELLASARMTETLEQLGEIFDYVVVDSPPLLVVADALELARFVDGVILVVRRNVTTRDEARELRAVLDRLELHLLGVVFSDVAQQPGYAGRYATGPAVNELPAAEARTHSV